MYWRSKYVAAGAVHVIETLLNTEHDRNIAPILEPAIVAVTLVNLLQPSKVIFADPSKVALVTVNNLVQ